MAEDCKESSTSTPLLNQDVFQSERSQELFRAIDEIQQAGSRLDLSLPELVIIGDQSAGKSSLLQSLTDIPFPVAGGLCTRFPTRIISRRTHGTQDIATISIQPCKSGIFHSTGKEDSVASEKKNDKARKYAEFKRSTSKLDATGYRDIVDEASDAMGIGETCQFSADVLKIVIEGPSRSPFSITDIPGIFQSVTKNLTKSDMLGVRHMVESFIKPKESIVICVASGTSDPATQAVFDMAKANDPTGLRTVGVITKCDASQHPDEILRCAQNEVLQLSHGWFVVRNRSRSEADQGISSGKRQQLEDEFFAKEPWTDLQSNRRGTPALKKYLTDLLCTNIETIFPSLLNDIEHRQQSLSQDTLDLGHPRSSVEDKRLYLSRIAQDFNANMSDTLRGRYEAMKSDSVKLRTLIRQMNDTFAEEIINRGHLLSFASIPEPPVGKTPGVSSLGSSTTKASTPRSRSNDTVKASLIGDESTPPPSSFAARLARQRGSSPYARKSSYPEADDTSLSESSDEDVIDKVAHGVNGMRLSTDYSQSEDAGLYSTPSKQERLSVASTPSRGGVVSKGSFSSAHSTLTAASTVEDSMEEPGSTVKPQSKMANLHGDIIYEWIGREVKASRGTELPGTINPNVLPVLFRHQASKWEAIAKKHVQTVVKHVDSACITTLDHSCKDNAVNKRLGKLIRTAKEKSQQKAFDALNDRITTMNTRHLQTNNPDFEKRVDEARRLRFSAALHQYKIANPVGKPSIDQSNKMVIDLNQVDLLFNNVHMAVARNLEIDIHDILKSYYEIERTNFIENVNQLIVEAYLNDPQGPCLQFSPMYLSGLGNEEIDRLAAEDEKLVEKRQECEAKLRQLEKVRGIAERYV